MVTQRRGDAIALAAQAVRRGATTVVAVGGDGTANEVANGCLDPDIAEDTPIKLAARLGYIALGTGRDFARALALPVDPVDAALSLLGPDGRTRIIDLGRARFVGADGRLTQRFFLSGADLGLGAEIAEYIDTRGRWLKRGGGFFAYLLGAIGAIRAHRPAQLTIQIDDAPATPIRANIVYLANGPYTAGGMRIAPRASLGDGVFDVLVARGASRATLLFKLLPSIYRGAHLGHPSVDHCQARRVRVESAARLLLQMDGERLGRGPAEVTVVPGALRVLTTR
jgi:YegS/Rv2252/BmrU family lipid kinase